MNAVVTLIFVFVSIAILMAGFAWLSRRLKQGGGSLFMIQTGATDAFYNRDKKQAIEQVVERNAGKKMEAQGNFEPPESPARNDNSPL